MCVQQWLIPGNILQARDLRSAKETQKQYSQGTRYLEAGDRDWALRSPLEPPSRKRYAELKMHTHCRRRKGGLGQGRVVPET